MRIAAKVENVFVLVGGIPMFKDVSMSVLALFRSKLQNVQQAEPGDRGGIQTSPGRASSLELNVKFSF